jgi:predicted transcriptional regulator
MKAVLLSIRPEWCDLIIRGQKTIEVRKTRPKSETPFRVYVYCTKAPQQLITIFKDGEETMDGEIHHGKPVFIKFNKLLPDSVRGKTQVVIGEFICDDIRRIGPEYCIVKEDIETAIAGSCLSIKQVKEYAGWDIGMNYADMKDLYGWHISNFKLYKKPVCLKDFWAIQPCTHRGDCCTCRRWDAEKLICRGEVFGIERPPQSWCYVEDGR